MSQHWDFLEDVHGQWYWRVTDADGSCTVSGCTFKSGVDCVVHAMRRGYLAGSPMAVALRQRESIHAQ